LTYRIVSPTASIGLLTGGRYCFSILARSSFSVVLSEVLPSMTSIYPRSLQRNLSTWAVTNDDTTVPVLAPGLGRTKTGRLWAVVRDERTWAGAPPAAFYCYSPDRRGERAEALLGQCHVNETLTLLFSEDTGFDSHHYAFHVSDAEFDAIFGRIKKQNRSPIPATRARRRNAAGDLRRWPQDRLATTPRARPAGSLRQESGSQVAPAYGRGVPRPSVR
jgi:Transposase IS66 family